MEKAQALDIVRSLANGVHPETGTPLAKESVFQHAPVVRALFVASQALEQMERFERRRSTMPAKSGSPWNEEEDRKLLAAFDAGKGLPELAAAHDRTMAAVRARLFKYGRINA
jgi:hypothetical protein